MSQDSTVTRSLKVIRSLDISDLSDEEYLLLLNEQDKESKDAKDFGPYWLEGVQGSLAEERRQSGFNKEQAYNRQVAEARRFYHRNGKLSLRSYLADPGQLDIKLSQLWSLYPSLQITFGIDVTDICKRSSHLLRSFLIYFYHHQEVFPSFVRWEIEEEFDRILNEENSCPISPTLRSEMKIIRKIFSVLEPNEGFDLLLLIYEKENILHWEKVGRQLVDNYVGLIRIPYLHIRKKVWKRGYRESHCNKHKSKDQRGEVAMSDEARTIEEIKQSILRKQALLLEKRLDAYLSLTDEEALLVNRKEVFRQLVNDGKPKDPSPGKIYEQAWSLSKNAESEENNV